MKSDTLIAMVIGVLVLPLLISDVLGATYTLNVDDSTNVLSATTDPVDFGTLAITPATPNAIGNVKWTLPLPELVVAVGVWRIFSENGTDVRDRIWDFSDLTSTYILFDSRDLNGDPLPEGPFGNALYDAVGTAKLTSGADTLKQ